MKTRITVLFIFLILFLAQAEWRSQEMEILVTFNNRAEAEALYSLKLNGDIYPDGKARMYVTPDELQRIKALQLAYSVVIADLNDYYKDFWNGRQGSYYSVDQIVTQMNTLVSSYPAICSKEKLGASIKNKEISVLKISDNVAVDESEAELVFDGGIHGDEVGGGQNLIMFAQELCSKYGSDATIKNLIDNREIFLYCLINPDGRVSMTRYNSNGVDCNRDWGYMWNGEGSSTGPCSQPEIKLIRNFLMRNQCVLQVSYHSGVEYILYPWGFVSGTTPDRAHHSYLAKLYSSSSTYSNLAVYASFDTYQTHGETLDYMYGTLGVAAMTEEISVNKQPAEIQGFYDKNAPAMKKMVEYAGYGVEGIVTDASTKKPVAAVLTVNQGFPFYNDPVVGDYHKFVIAGTHTINVFANGYTPKTVGSITVEDKKSTATNIELTLDASSNKAWGYKVTSVQSGSGNTFAVLGANDSKTYTVSGTNGIVIDLQYPINNITGKEITVYISGSSASYTCSAGQSPDGPWKSLGTSTKTDSFDIATASLQDAQYMKITGSNVGIDAICGTRNNGTGISSGYSLSYANAGLAITRKNTSYIIQSSCPERALLKIFNAQGKCCQSSYVKNGIYHWQPDSKGLFLVQMQTGDDIQIKPFVVF